MKKINTNITLPPQDKLNSLIKYYQTEKYAEAEKLSLSITEEFPEHQLTWKILAVIYLQTGKIGESLVAIKKSIILEPQDSEAHYNLGVTLEKLERLEEAEVSYRQAITLKLDYADAHYNLGYILKKLGKLEEAEVSYRQVIRLKPDYANAYSNLGNVLEHLSRSNEAEASYRKAITLKPDYAVTHNNLGNLLQKLGRLEEAEVSYRQAITLKPRLAKVHYNLGNNMYQKGDMLSAISSFKNAIKFKQNYDAAWNNIYYPLQAIKLQKPSIHDQLLLIDEYVSSNYAQIAKSILSYRLNQGDPSAEKCLSTVLSLMSSDDTTFIKNPMFSPSDLIKVPNPPKEIVALMSFTRGGSGMFHSLIDGHPEISTLPSIYFSQFFDYSIWEKIVVGGWEEMADCFVSTYEVLFDSSSNTKTPSSGMKFIHNIGRNEGMTNVGTKGNEILSVDKKVFIKELKELMSYYERLDAFVFFKLVHIAYNKAIHDHNEKKLIFYHIHNPDPYAQLNFLRLSSNTNWIIMVREPLQGCESWISDSFRNYDYNKITGKIYRALFDVDCAIYQNNNSIGVRLEDLKEHPKQTIPALCKWLGIKENDSLYQMTAQGKKWWGDPSSPDYRKDGMNPFGKTSINRKLGSIFSKNDQLILNTLFYPFSVRFGYTEENLDQFKNDLQIIRPMINQMFDFEKKIIQETKMNREIFMKSGSYLFLRSGMIERWNTLNKFYTYHNMLSPLKIG